MEMKATHDLENAEGDRWKLRCLGKEHYWCKVEGPYADNKWTGPVPGSVVDIFGGDDYYLLTKLNKFKGNK